MCCIERSQHTKLRLASGLFYFQLTIKSSLFVRRNGPLGAGNHFLHVAIGMRYLPVLIGAYTLRFKSDCLMADATGNRVVRGVFGFGYPAESFSKRIWADVISRRSLIVRFWHGEPLFILCTIVQMYVR
jgi:hypothetical protein